RGRLQPATDRVVDLTLKRYPDLRVPYHSRWRHFEAGGIHRKPQLDALLAGRSTVEAARAHFDLTVTSVLLDAGAGAAWRYTEDGTGQQLSRSEGLGVASWHGFIDGLFSATPDDNLRADASALEKIDAARLRQIFQSDGDNTMVGLEGRAGLLARLGSTLRLEAARLGIDAKQARPSLLFDQLTQGGTLQQVSATAVLARVLHLLGPIWTSGSNVQGLMAGDVWRHRWAGDAVGGINSGQRDPTTGGWVPFHKLSQWLAYSLLEPLQWAGVTVTGVDALTALPEYRNGGLLIDTGVIVPRHPRELARTFKPGDDLVVEWRALTVALIDEIAVLMRAHLGKTAEELPLACVLEGGTWAAGREIAAELRAGGEPPVKIESDGTVF
ncbi:MAG TPA: DUF1688 family protein, partial [Rubrivivax sp.]|nr:DUF1688 family protein [Rubrivivax sp.]